MGLTERMAGVLYPGVWWVRSALGCVEGVGRRRMGGERIGVRG